MISKKLIKTLLIILNQFQYRGHRVKKYFLLIRKKLICFRFLIDVSFLHGKCNQYKSSSSVESTGLLSFHADVLENWAKYIMYTGKTWFK